MADSARTAQGRNHVGGGVTVVRNGGKAGDRLDVPGVNGVRPSVKRRTTVVVATFASTPTRRTPRRRLWAVDHAGGSVNSPLRWQVGGRPFLTDPTALARRTAAERRRRSRWRRTQRRRRYAAAATAAAAAKQSGGVSRPILLSPLPTSEGGGEPSSGFPLSLSHATWRGHINIAFSFSKNVLSDTLFSPPYIGERETDCPKGNPVKWRGFWPKTGLKPL